MERINIDQEQLMKLGSKVFDETGGIKLCGRNIVMELVNSLEQLDSTFTRHIPDSDTEGWAQVREEVNKSKLDPIKHKENYEEYISSTSLLYQVKKHYYRLIEGVTKEEIC